MPPQGLLTFFLRYEVKTIVLVHVWLGIFALNLVDLLQEGHYCQFILIKENRIVQALKMRHGGRQQ